MQLFKHKKICCACEMFELFIGFTANNTEECANNTSIAEASKKVTPFAVLVPKALSLRCCALASASARCVALAVQQALVLTLPTVTVVATVVHS